MIQLSMDNLFYIYIIKCSGERLYTGYTTDPVKRFKEHRTGRRGARFTRGFAPLSFEALWEVKGVKGEAMKIEAFIKTLKRADKIKIIEEPDSLIKILPGPLGSIHIKVTSSAFDISF